MGMSRPCSRLWEVRTRLATRTDIIIPKGSDVIVRVTIDGADDITGQTFQGTLRGPTAPFTSTAIVINGPSRIVDWTLADTDTDALPAGTGYRWDVWRVDDGSEYPVAYGHVKLEQYARGG
jgi:hypothetical protein